MIDNIDRLLDRDEKLNIIAMKSNKLNEGSRNINYMAAKIKKQEKMKQMKMMMFIGIAAAVKFLFIF
jgi:hypothetical protein